VIFFYNLTISHVVTRPLPLPRTGLLATAIRAFSFYSPPLLFDPRAFLFSGGGGLNGSADRFFLESLFFPLGSATIITLYQDPSFLSWSSPRPPFPCSASWDFFFWAAHKARPSTGFSGPSSPSGRFSSRRLRSGSSSSPLVGDEQYERLFSFF